MNNFDPNAPLSPAPTSSIPSSSSSSPQPPSVLGVFEREPAKLPGSMFAWIIAGLITLLTVVLVVLSIIILEGPHPPDLPTPACRLRDQSFPPAPDCVCAELIADNTPWSMYAVPDPRNMSYIYMIEQVSL